MSSERPVGGWGRIARDGLLATILIARVAGADPVGHEQSPTKLTDAEIARNVASFEVVWKTIRDTHFDPTLGGLDWDAVHDELKPKVEKADSMADARSVMTDALDRLHQTHFGIIPFDLVRAVEDHGGPGETGIDIRVIAGKAVVSRVSEGSSAALAGVKPGWVVAKVRDKPIDEALQAVGKAFAKSSLLEARKCRAILARLSGFPGTKIEVDFLDGDDKPVHQTLDLEKPSGVPAQFGNLPTIHVKFDARRLGDKIGYVSLSAFFDPTNVLRKFADAIRSWGDTDGLILDLRGNPGGIGAMSMGIGGWLVEKGNSKLGTMTTRDSKINFILLPRATPYLKPVAVLIDELSMSTSEILAGGLKDLGRVRVFGTKSPGAALPSRIDVLPNGDRFQYAFANYISTGGKPLEGSGVTPDVETPLTRAALLAGGDPALDAAVAWIRSEGRPR